MKHLMIILVLLAPLSTYAGGKKTPPASITFHMEGAEAEAPKFARKIRTLAGDRYFRKVPEVATRDIVAYSPFPADDKKTYGLVFKLSPQASRRLFATTTNNRGKLLLSLINGQAAGVVRIDKPVSDGILVVWSGITQAEVKKYDMLVPRIGESQKEWKARLKKAKKQ